MPLRAASDSVFDFIIIGAGSAGCVLANRLTASGRHRVLVVEAGGSDRHPWVQIPIGYGRAFYHPRLNWMYQTEADAGTAQRRSYWPRGKVLGGSSSINAMVYIRGHPEDYNEWQREGNVGWGWQDVLPYFRQAQGCSVGYPARADEWHGTDGPLYVADLSADMHPTCQNFIRAGRQLGIQYNPDFNAATQEGVGHYQQTIKSGRRMSAARAYLHPARRRANLRVETHALVSRVRFDHSRACGIEYWQHGKHKTARVNGVRGEVIISAGAINSPQLLMLSGVGAAADLSALGIDLVLEQPQVGRNLQDHLCTDYLYRSRVPTLNDQLYPLRGKLWHGLRYVLRRRGPLALGVNQGGGFIRTNAQVDRPNMQLFFSPASYTKAPPGKRPLMNPDQFSAFILSAQPTRPTSRGYIRLKTADPREHPSIHPNYLSTAQDVREMLEGVRFLRRLAAAPALREIVDTELLPGQDMQREVDLIDDFRQRCNTVFHPVSTCRMAATAAAGVVDAALRVYGLHNLRVVDASVFPSLIAGNTNAPTIMLAEKAAHLILQQHRRD